MRFLVLRDFLDSIGSTEHVCSVGAGGKDEGARMCKSTLKAVAFFLKERVFYYVALSLHISESCRHSWGWRDNSVVTEG